MTPPEFSRIQNIGTLPSGRTSVSLAASADECKRLAARLDLIALAALAAEFELTRFAGERVLVTGTVTARVTRRCSVTLEEFSADLVEPVRAGYAPDGVDYDAPVDLAALVEETEDPPEKLIDGRIDLGELAVQHLALALDPFPRAPGAEWDGAMAPDEAGAENPFAMLTQWRDRLRK